MTASSAHRVGAAVLAAGASRRLGRPKQLAAWRGTPLLRHVTLSALGARCDAVAVILGCRGVEIAPALAGLDVEVIENPAWPEGMASSVRRAAAWANERRLDALVLVVVDQPRLDAAHLDRLIDAHARGAPRVASRYGDALGVPALFDRASFPELLALEGDRGARDLLRHRPRAAAIDWPEGADDVDDARDLERLAPLR